MSTIASGKLTVLFLYEVADAIDLSAVNHLIGATTATRVGPRPPAPAYTQYSNPPIAIQGEALGLPLMEGWQVRVKVFDYGVASLALSRPMPLAERSPCAT